MDTVDMVEETEHGVRTIVEEIIDKLIEVAVAKAEKRVKAAAKIIELAVAEAETAKIIEVAVAKAEKRVKSVADGVKDESSNTQVSRGEEDS